MQRGRSRDIDSTSSGSNSRAKTTRSIRSRDRSREIFTSTIATPTGVTVTPAVKRLIQPLAKESLIVISKTGLKNETKYELHDDSGDRFIIESNFSEVPATVEGPEKCVCQRVPDILAVHAQQSSQKGLVESTIIAERVSARKKEAN